MESKELGRRTALTTPMTSVSERQPRLRPVRTPPRPVFEEVTKGYVLFSSASANADWDKLNH